MDGDATCLGAIGVILLWIICTVISLAIAAALVYYGAGLAHLGWKAVH
jgi:hypothetical protein